MFEESECISGEIIAQSIKTVARLLGFSDCRIAPAVTSPHAEEFQEWLRQGKHGEMEWLERNESRRCDPRLVVEGCQSVICLAFDYGGIADPIVGISTYAQGEDYHKVIESKLMDICELLEDYRGSQRCYVDTGPVLERDFAELSGLGWRGKSGLIVRRKGGSRFFIGTILTTLKLPADSSVPDQCGHCSRCQQECPTHAIGDDGTIDARRCVSYLTIENKGAIPLEFRRAIGNRIYGCDGCLNACPWNASRFFTHLPEIRFRPPACIKRMSLRDFILMDEMLFGKLFKDSPIKRIKWRGLIRNVCVALGNTGTLEDIQPLIQVQGKDPLVDEHAQWAIDEIRHRTGDCK